MRTSSNFVTLLDTASAFEEAINDEWLPYEILGLTPDKAKNLLDDIIADFDNVANDEWTLTIRTKYEKIKNDTPTKAKC